MDNYLSEYKDKTILITGGAGCIGSNLTRALIKAGAARIIVLDDLSAAEKWNVPIDAKVTFIEGSILDEEVLKRAFSSLPDFVFFQEVNSSQSKILVVISSIPIQ